MSPDALWENAWKKIRRIPWALDGRIQDPSGLENTLRNERQRLVELGETPLISLLTPMWNTEPQHLSEAIASCQAQTYGHWELVLYDDASTRREHLAIAEEASRTDSRIRLILGAENGGISHARNAAYRATKGEFVAILDHDDLLHPQALGVLVRQAMAAPDVTFWFTNECKIDEHGRVLSDFFSKCAFSYATLLRTNYLCHLTAMRRRLYEEVETRDHELFRAQFDGAEDHDFFLRISRCKSFKAGHIPLFTYLWRMAASSTASAVSAKPKALGRSADLVSEHLAQYAPGIEVQVTPSIGPHANRLNLIRAKALPGKYRIGVVVPYRDCAEMTLQCLESLEAQQGPFQLDVVLVNNKSTDQATPQKLAAWLGTSRRHQYKIIDYPAAFNFGRLHNTAIKAHLKDAPWLLLLNNDAAFLDSDALMQLVFALIVDDSLGIAGLKLLYPNEQHIQHGGIRYFPELRQSAYFKVAHTARVSDFVNDEHAVAAVTFACALLRASAYDAIGGFDEIHAPNGQGDVAAALAMARAGYQTFYIGSARGIHHESRTRGDAIEDYEITHLGLTYAPEIRAQVTRAFGYNHFVHLNTAGATQNQIADIPLRYKIADRLNDIMKRYVGGLHRLVKRQNIHRI